MSQLLDKALAEVQKLPESEQDAIAAIILEQLADERKWDEAFARSQDQLKRLAGDARAEYRSGQTKELYPERL